MIPIDSDEFEHKTSYIENIISLSFCAYIKHSKQISDVTWTSILVLMLICYSSNEHDDVSNIHGCYFKSY
jgi:hypothetical protein